MRASFQTQQALVMIGVAAVGLLPFMAVAELRLRRSARGNQASIPRMTNSPDRNPRLGHPGPEAPSEKVLIFWATGASKDTVELIKKNVEHARKELKHVSVFLAHYDRQRAEWQDLAGKEWYEKNVDNSAEQDGYKFQLLKSLVNSREIYPSDYDWLWVLDEDADFQGTPLPKMLQLATESGSLISTPAFTSTTGSKDMSFPFQQPRGDCRIRYAPIVEVTFPLFRTEALQVLMAECDHCMGNSTVWGLDRMWCSWSARRLGKDKVKGCAILDGAPMVHRDFRSLSGKYYNAVPYALQWALNPVKMRSFKFYTTAKKDQDDVQKHYPDDYVSTEASKVHELSCVK